MIHIYGFVVIFLITLGFSAYYYQKNAEKLIVFHKFSIVIDVMAWLGGGSLIAIAILFYDLLPLYNPLLWIQVSIGSALLNIHVVRFVIHLRTKDKFLNSRKGREF